MDETRRALVRAWLTKSAHDLKSARIVGTADDGPLDSAIYHCQQAAEKAVKAYLVFQGITPAKTHDIRKLTLEASSFEARFNEYLDHAAALTPYAWEFRYPDDLADTYPTREEFDEALLHVEAICQFVFGLLPPEVAP